MPSQSGQTVKRKELPARGPVPVQGNVPSPSLIPGKVLPVKLQALPKLDTTCSPHPPSLSKPKSLGDLFPGTSSTSPLLARRRQPKPHTSVATVSAATAANHDKPMPPPVPKPGPLITRTGHNVRAQLQPVKGAPDFALTVCAGTYHPPQTIILHAGRLDKPGKPGVTATPGFSRAASLYQLSARSGESAISVYCDVSDAGSIKDIHLERQTVQVERRGQVRAGVKTQRDLIPLSLHCTSTPRNSQPPAQQPATSGRATWLKFW